MAPQILHQPSYSKAVDIWSCAIIIHPIFLQGMKSQTFKQKLRTCSFPKLPNALADNFIRNLSKIEYTERYSVNEALKHPWITRNQEDQIPLSVNQSMHSFNTSHCIADALKFVRVVGLVFGAGGGVPEEYQGRVRGFVEKHQESRMRSPSYKKTRRKANDTISKLKQVIIRKQSDKKDEQNDNQYLDLDSPVLVKHQKLFLRLFDKPKVQCETIVLQQCQKPQPEPQPQLSEQPKTESPSVSPPTPTKQQEEPPSPILESSTSFTSSRNNAVPHYDVDLPLIKINYEKKEKTERGLRKLNSLREDNSGKYEQNFSYFRTGGNKNSEEKNREVIASSKSKRISYKFEEFRLECPPKNGNKKPQTAERNKLCSKSKDPTKPMTFGMRGNHF